MKIILILAMIAASTSAIKQILNLLENEINKSDELPEIKEEEM